MTRDFVASLASKGRALLELPQGIISGYSDTRKIIMTQETRYPSFSATTLILSPPTFVCRMPIEHIEGGPESTSTKLAEMIEVVGTLSQGNGLLLRS